MAEQKAEASSQEMLKTDRYLWIARAFSAVAVLALVANVLLFVAISSLYPLVRIQPFYLNVLDKNQQVIEITPLPADKLQQKENVEALVRQYVLSRFKIGNDVKEVEERFGPDGIVALMSSEATYKEFRNFYKESWEERIPSEGLTVEPYIKTMDTIKASDNLTWSVELRLEEMTQHSAEPKIIDMHVDVQVRFDPLFTKSSRIATWQDRLKNPLGFRVTGFGWKIKK